MTMRVPTTFSGPALVDIQLNGYAGFDFNSHPDSWQVEDFVKVKEALARRGVLRSLPTFITDDITLLISRVKKYRAIIEAEPALATTFPLVHMEGPFISMEDGPRGTHPLRYCATPIQYPWLLDQMIDASGGRLGIITLAPEVEGVLSLIEDACRKGICVAIGHTGGAREELIGAIDAGAKLSTHLGNASHELLQRLDNYVQVQLSEDRLWASFVADGHHMPFGTLKNFIRAKEYNRCILITDAMAAADVGPGRYRLADEEVIVTEALRASKPGQPGLAGSALTLDRAIVNVAQHCGCSFEEGWAMASTHPAQLLQLDPLPEISVLVHADGFTLMTDGAP